MCEANILRDSFGDIDYIMRVKLVKTSSNHAKSHFAEFLVGISWTIIEL